jgi:hypothetical protein
MIFQTKPRVIETYSNIALLFVALRGSFAEFVGRLAGAEQPNL